MDHRRHYNRLAARFTQHWSYSHEFVTWMTGCLTARLQLQPHQSLLDVGSGTGIYAARLAEYAHQVMCLDPSAAMLEHIPDHPRLVCTAGSMEQLASRQVLADELFDAILLKEVIHHIDDRPTAIHALVQHLAPRGRMLIAMLPARIDYPLFPEALDRYNRGTLTPDHVATWMHEAGLQVTTSTEQHHVRLPTERYLDMVRDRYLSLLTNFTDTELAAGIRDIRKRQPGNSIAFDDRFVFVLGVTPIEAPQVQPCDGRSSVVPPQ